MKETKYAGTQTEKNLMAAFAGESEARNKYTYFASKAKKEGYEQIAALFLKTADNEKEHAKLWFKELNGIGDTAENLLSAAEGENYEWTDMYLSLIHICLSIWGHIHELFNDRSELSLKSVMSRNWELLTRIHPHHHLSLIHI